MRIRSSLLVSSLLILSAIYGIGETAPTITIRLSPDIHSEDINISYVLYGSFGAIGNSVRPHANVNSYRINPVYESRLAASVKAVIYAAGCEFDTLEADIAEGTDIEKSYACVPLATVSLVGHITGTRLYRHRDLEVVVRYLGDWECRFFEFSDCMVPQIELARAPVNENGEFEATIADFSPEQKSPLHHRGELWVILRDARTWNLIGAGLTPPKELQTRSTTGLVIRPFYPPPVEFQVVFASAPVPAPPNAR